MGLPRSATITPQCRLDWVRAAGELPNKALMASELAIIASSF